MLMGIPHVVLDNSYGKNSAFHDTWTREWPLARLSASPAAALDDLQTLDAREPGTHR
jgi:pyruvyl transferase EpsO